MVSLVIGLFVFVAVLVAEGLGLNGMWRVLATVTLVLIATTAGVAVLSAARGGMLVPPGIEGIVSNEAFMFRTLWFYSAAGLLLAAYFAIRDKEAAISTAARAAQLEGVETQRATMESRLKVLQARVEPELLFGVLEDLRERYGQDPRAADVLLDDLSDYLRAALPQLRSEVSTLGREIALVRAYLKVLPSGRAGRLALVVQISREIEDLPFPPMVFLPLVQAAVEVAGKASVVIDVHDPEVDGQGAVRAVIVITARSAATLSGWSEERLDGVRETLVKYFNTTATLQARVEGDAATAELRWLIRVGEFPTITHIDAA